MGTIMEKFPRGTLPPSAWVPVVPGEPKKVAPPPSTLERGQADEGTAAQTPRGTCDLSVTCPTCSTLMQPEHAHYRCLTCGYRDSCCF
jgi:rubredoxin